MTAQGCPDRTFGTFLGVGDDTVFTIQPIGFAFPFAGATYTDVHVCANGYLFLSNGGVPAPAAGDFSSTPLELTTQAPRIAVLWNDMNHLAANNAGIYVNATAAKCTITWDNAVNYGMTTRFLLQAQLFPSGEVQLFWGKGATNNSTYNFAAGSGVVGLSPGMGAALPAASDLSTAGSSPSDTVFEHWPLQGSFDLTHRSLQLIPTNPGWAWVPSTWAACADSTDYGIGCLDAADSFYELMAPAAFDLANTHWTMVRTATGYTVTNTLPAALVVPSPAATIVANGDDIVTTVTLAQPMPVPGGTTTQLSISSNGNIALSSLGNGAGFAPDVGNFLAFAQTSIAAAWHDYNPALAGSGKVLFEQVGTTAYVTWDGVYSYLSTAPDKFQYQFDLTTGDVTVVYSVMSLGASEYLVGYSRGGASPRTEPIDLSVALGGSLTMADTGVQGLTLTTNGLPLLGNAGFQFDVSNIPAVSPVGLLFFGDQPAPGLDLGFLGMPGCRAYSSANLTSAVFPAVQPAGTGTQGLPIPNSGALVGAGLTAQALAFTLATPLNLVASNGTQLVLGL
ncbi:MAG: hypothetical protein JNK15_21980 [Planctomycetes bacterium]|nr:hypothetical protein [Planctomycetota bacterium]